MVFSRKRNLAAVLPGNWSNKSWAGRFDWRSAKRVLHYFILNQRATLFRKLAKRGKNCDQNWVASTFERFEKRIVLRGERNIGSFWQTVAPSSTRGESEKRDSLEKNLRQPACRRIGRMGAFCG